MKFRIRRYSRRLQAIFSYFVKIRKLPVGETSQIRAYNELFSCSNTEYWKLIRTYNKLNSIHEKVCKEKSMGKKQQPFLSFFFFSHPE